MKRTKHFRKAALTFLIALLMSCNDSQIPKETADTKSPGFSGKIELDVRDSKADWGPFIRKKAPEDPPTYYSSCMMTQGLHHGLLLEEELICPH